MDSLDSISIIKDVNSTLENNKENSNLKIDKDLKDHNYEESDLSEISNSSNFLMVNPLNEKTNAYGFSTNRKSQAESSSAGAEWTMAIPSIKYPKES